MTTLDVAGHPLTVNQYAAPHFKAFLDDLASRGYKIASVSGYSPRVKADGSGTVSEHAYGNAIDINQDNNPYRSDKTDLPKDVSQIAAKYGLIWGGDWRGNSKDPMHFEWTGKTVNK